MSTQKVNFGRIGLGGASAIMAMGQAGKSFRAAKHGELGNMAMHAGLAAGMGYVGYHALLNNPQHARNISQASLGIQKLAGNEMLSNSPWVSKQLNGIANFIKKSLI